MFDKWFNVPVHFYLRVIALSMLTVGVCTSNVLMSIGTIWLIANWLFEAEFSKKRDRFIAEPIAWVFVFLFLFGILSLLWSQNIDYGIHDLRIKLPLLVIPLVLSTSETLPKRYFYFIIYLFLGTLLLTSIWNYFQFQQHITEVYDVRQMSLFISHIRFSVLINLGIFFTYYLLLKRKLSIFILVPIIIWLCFYQYKSQVVNGYALFVILSVLSIIYWINHLTNKRLKKIMGTGLVGVVALLILSIGAAQLLRCLRLIMKHWTFILQIITVTIIRKTQI